MQKSDGMNFAPVGKPAPVCQKGDFVFAVAALDHGHINGMTNGLLEAGGELAWVYDTDPQRAEEFSRKYGGAKIARSIDEILSDARVQLVAAAAIPHLRGPLGCRVMRAGKDYFTDKTPFTSLAQLDEARKTAKETGKKYAVYYSERLHNESSIFAGQLVEQGAIGKVVQVIGLGPHRLNAPSRPAWFFEKEKYGGILSDIGSHQVEQFLFFTGSKDAKVLSARVANFAHPAFPELEDFGEAHLVGDSGASNYFRVDWFTPDGLGSWGDGRALILGTDGYIELRKNIDVAQNKSGNHIFLVDQKEEHHFEVEGKIGFPFFGRLIRDVLERTESAMTQEHAFKAVELCLKAQEWAEEHQRKQEL